MTAYNPVDLYNQLLQENSSGAFRTGLISKESYQGILYAHPHKLYTPNYFIRIALAILTAIAVLFAAILLGLLFSIGGSARAAIFCVLFAITCYGSLELFVKRKHFYNAGVDNVLMASVIIFIISAFFVYDFNTSYLLISGVVMLLCLYMCLRLTDAFMALTSYLGFFAFVFLLYIKLGVIAKATAPFLMMAISVLSYFAMNKLLKRDGLIIYSFCLKSVMFLTLVSFYVSSNYFVVKELSNQMFGLEYKDIPFGWFFWIMTIGIPFSYILYGIAKRDFLFIRTGLGLVAATVFTIRYYYSMLPIELIMLFAGTVLITLSFLLIQYLKKPRYGYTFQLLYPSNEDLLDAEALIIAQTFGTESKVENNSLYGGGSGGGAGATGNF